MTKRKTGFRTNLAIAFILLLASAVYPQGLFAASAEITPKLYIQYNHNDNIDAVDEDDIDPTEMSWMDYLLGIEARAKQVDTEEGIDVSLGYSQYVDSEGDTEDLSDTSPSKYNFFRIMGGAWFRFTGRRVTLELMDDIVRTRSLEDLYGEGTSSISYRYLYTDNMASVQLRFQPSPKTRALARYSYDTLVFDTPENEWLEDTKPSDSWAHLGLARFEYDFSGKTTGFIDVQGGQRFFEDRLIIIDYDTVTGEPIDSDNIKTADYTYYQGLLGLTYRFSPRSSLSAAAGAHTKSFTNEGLFDMEDYTVPAGRISFVQKELNKYRLELTGETSSSVYGMDMFFNYYSAAAKFRYYFYKKMYLQTYVNYRQDVFDVEVNDREDIWDDDRIDNLFYYGASFNWELFFKNNRNWLALELFYSHRTRDSNINDEDDYAEVFSGPYSSYDTDIDYYGAQLRFMPTILIGN